MDGLVHLFSYLQPFLVAAATIIGLSVVAGIASSLAFRAMGLLRRRLILLTGVIGVPVHELSHAIVATLFGMRVRKISLFEPDPQSPQLGYVNFSYSPALLRHRIGLFFVGIAPLIAGSAATMFLLTQAGGDLPVSSGLPAVRELPQAMILTHEIAIDLVSRGLAPAAMAFVATAIALHSAPSWADLKHAGVGLATGITLLLILLLPGLAFLADNTELGPVFETAFARAQGAIAQTGLLMTWAGLVVGALFLPFRLIAWIFSRGEVSA